MDSNTDNTEEQRYKPGMYSNEGNIHNPIIILNEDVKDEESSSNIYCMHCDLNFINLTEYEHHNVTMHGQTKIISCSVCNTIFKRPDHLKRHMLSLHGNQKFYICPVCDVDCKRQDALLKHIENKHNSEKVVFQCKQCDFCSDSLNIFERHEMKHSLIDRHICLYCKAEFKRRDHMLRHVKSQHLNQSVVCPLCSRTYKRRDHLIRHIREKHRMGFIDGKLVKSADIIQ